MAPSTFLVLLIASLLPFLCSSDDANQLDGPLLIDDIDRKLSLTKDYYSAPKSKKEPKSKHKKVELPDLEEIPERVIPQCPAPALPVNRYNKAPVYTPGNENCTSSSGIFENHSNDCRASCSRYGYRYGVGECEASCDKEGDDRCYPLLRRCKNPTFWSVISKRTGKGACRRRKCGRYRVYVPCTGLCHGIFDRSICNYGRRLYYDAHGDPVCDCPLGSYPFPYSNSYYCAKIFTQGPCPKGQVVTPVKDGVRCAPSRCRPFYKVHYRYDHEDVEVPSSDYGPPTKYKKTTATETHREEVPSVPYEKDGRCYVLGLKGPCDPNKNEWLAWDIFKQKAVCHDIGHPSSPYYESQQDYSIIDQIYNQGSPYWNGFEIGLVYEHNKQPATKNYGKNYGYKRNDDIDRQDGLTNGIFEAPTRAPRAALLPTYPGSNFEQTTNPILPDDRTEALQSLQAVAPIPGDDDEVQEF